MSDFFSNIVANVIGTFVGAGLAIASTCYLQRRAAARRERRLLQGLLDRLYRSRALAPNRSRPPGQLNAPEQLDLERCAESILTTRDRLATVSDEIEVLDEATGVLDAMYVHCLGYLNLTQGEPERYVDNLAVLRERLTGQATQLAALVSGLNVRALGTADVAAELHS